MSTFLHTNLHCLALVARHHGVDLSPERLQHDYAVDERPVEMRQLLRMAKDAGLRARQISLSWTSLVQLGEAFPVLAELDNGNWVVIAGPAMGEEEAKIRVLDPLAERPDFILLNEEQFTRSWRGSVVMMKRNFSINDADQPFGFRWFIPEIIKQRSFFRDVALAAIVLYGLGLMTPIFFQLVIDKVLVHQSYATLTVLTIGIGIALVFDAAFSFLRRYLLLYATNRIDIRIATRTFGHLLNLPIALFEQASAGVLVKHMQQTGRIREFLTGRLFLTLLDGVSLLVFIPILLLYSVKLTLVVIGFAALVGLVVMLLVGPFQRRLQALYKAEGDRQALLVETVHGMRTVKSLALEPRQRRAWDDYSAQSISVRFRVEKISTAAQSMTGLLEKLMSVAIIGLGALDVFSGAMTIGALVAFNMLAGRVSGPLVQIVTMVHEYQEVALSVRMLGEIMNQRPEQAGRGRGIRPHLRGNIQFDKVTFRYGPDGPPALDDVSFNIPAGSVFGVVGKSGSGKTTITRLIQGLYQNQQGIVRMDGYDSREIDLVHLRTSTGVVLQDNFLFRGTVRENIAAAKPDASIEEIMEVARIAGAEEFIERLPRGFDTMLEENASNLSGGQKQRLAIARALITDPKLLILDEATSALDPDSETIIRQNLSQIAAGRTVVIVSHRLSTLVDADAILVVERGKIADIGRHDQLVTRCMTYRHLWSQQMRQVA
ncbi:MULTISPECIES: peptidase domain-containing ABC transporter [unclassified Rhizobium]|uniref:peptidase domain-containing ABC transporter n=3 Tax=Rhizobium TaxID=379 RepID=UPI0016130BFF|nr:MULTISPECIES: peptidase domain-containing ABC transporter [unclassified Rhizobium]MBB3315410.1 ATP-binding cassette subfamily B protein [Rhizobium sp. BK181]MCS3738367.1 ATP-binding cassette subfamily B protein [Rhizobium sp. BK661]